MDSTSTFSPPLPPPELGLGPNYLLKISQPQVERALHSVSVFQAQYPDASKGRLSITYYDPIVETKTHTTVPARKRSRRERRGVGAKQGPTHVAGAATAAEEQEVDEGDDGEEEDDDEEVKEKEGEEGHVASGRPKSRRRQ